MFVEGKAMLGVGFRTALSRLAAVAGGPLLEQASADAYREAISALGGFRLPPSMSDMPALARFHSREVVVREDSALVAFRWEASVRGHGRYPVLDADITLTPAGEAAALARLMGVYRLPSAVLAGLDDRSAARTVVTGTAQVLLSRIVQAMTGLAGPAP